MRSDERLKGTKGALGGVDKAVVRTPDPGRYKQSSGSERRYTIRTSTQPRSLTKKSGESTSEALRSPRGIVRVDRPAPAEGTVDSAADQIESSLREILAAVESGKRPEEVMTARPVEIPAPALYGPSEVKATRTRLGASQTVFARMMGVSPELVQHWEQGIREPGGIARRLMDRINADPPSFLAGVVRRG